MRGASDAALRPHTRHRLIPRSPFLGGATNGSGADRPRGTVVEQCVRSIPRRHVVCVCSFLLRCSCRVPLCLPPRPTAVLSTPSECASMGSGGLSQHTQQQHDGQRRRSTHTAHTQHRHTEDRRNSDARRKGTERSAAAVEAHDATRREPQQRAGGSRRERSSREDAVCDACTSPSLALLRSLFAPFLGRFLLPAARRRRRRSLPLLPFMHPDGDLDRLASLFSSLLSSSVSACCVHRAQLLQICQLGQSRRRADQTDTERLGSARHRTAAY